MSKEFNEWYTKYIDEQDFNTSFDLLIIKSYLEKLWHYKQIEINNLKIELDCYRHFAKKDKDLK